LKEKKEGPQKKPKKMFRTAVPLMSGSESVVYSGAVKLKKNEAEARHEYTAMRNCCSASVPEVHLNGCMIVMPLIPTDMFRVVEDFAKQRTTIPDDMMRDFVRQMAWALFVVHSRGYIHRDVKLENFLVDVDRRKVFLSDFGFAIKHQGHKVTGKCGSPTYVAPEVVMGAPYDNKVDVFSLGVCVFTMLTGCKPFASGYILALPAKQAWLRVIRAIGDAMKDLVTGSLRVNADMRMSSLAAARTSQAAYREKKKELKT
jgi:serine/threonine protein kinase